MLMEDPVLKSDRSPRYVMCGRDPQLSQDDHGQCDQRDHSCRAEAVCVFSFFLGGVNFN